MEHGMSQLLVGKNKDNTLLEAKNGALWVERIGIEEKVGFPKKGTPRRPQQ